LEANTTPVVPSTNVTTKLNWEGGYVGDPGRLDPGHDATPCRTGVRILILDVPCGRHAAAVA
jgi:hypothetical protein